MAEEEKKKAAADAQEIEEAHEHEHHHHPHHEHREQHPHQNIAAGGSWVCPQPDGFQCCRLPVGFGKAVSLL